MLIDLHAHTSGISKCCQIPAPEVLKQAKAVGLDGIVLTNHYQKSYIDGDAKGLVEKYIEEYHYTKECGKQLDCKVFYGVEVTMEQYPNVHMLVYGVGESFLRKNPFVFDLSLQELYNFVKEEGGTLVQAHPFRNGCHVLDVEYLDGIEINCHPLYNKSFSAELTEIAKESGLMLTCGGDFHADTYRPHCGVYLPDSIGNSLEIGEYIRSTNEIKLLVQEPNCETYGDVVFQRQ